MVQIPGRLSSTLETQTGRVVGPTAQNLCWDNAYESHGGETEARYVARVSLGQPELLYPCVIVLSL